MLLLSKTAKNPELERAASRDDSRPVLTHVYLNAEKSRLEAADSYKAAIVPCELEEGDESGLIPAPAIAAQRKASKYAAAPLRVNGNVELATPENTQTWTKGEGQWPNFEQLTPANLSGFKVGLNPTFLLELAKALGDPSSVTLQFALVGEKMEGPETGYFPGSLRPMIVKVPSGGDGYGILMPIRTS
jgi:hypothetical protein